MDKDSDLLPRQFGRVDAAPEKPWRMLEAEKRLPDAVFQCVDGGRRRVGEGLFGLGPNLLVRVEFRRVSWKVVQVKAPAAAEVQAHGLVPMDFGAVPQKDDLTAEVAQQQTEELDHPLAVDVLPVTTEIHADPLADRRDRDRGDDRDSVVAVAMAKDRGLSDRSPGLADVRGEHEAAFVEEDQVCAELTGVFLYPANRSVSIWQSPLRCARSPGAPVSARSIPIVAGVAAGRQSARNAPPSASRSDPRLGAASKGPWHTPPAGRRRPATSSASPFGPASAEAVAPGSISCASLLFRSVDRLDSSVPLSSPTTSQPKPPADRSRPSAVTQLLSGGVPPAAVDCQEVSSFPAYQNGE